MAATAVKNLATSKLAQLALKFSRDDQLLQELPAFLQTGVKLLNENYLIGKSQLSAYGTSRGFIGNKVIKLLNQDDVVGAFTRLLNENAIGQRIASSPAVTSLIRTLERVPWQTVSQYNGNIFGRAWTAADGVEFGRGASNLFRVAQEAGSGARLTSVARTAGFLRGAGVVGGVVSTGMDIANVASQGNPITAFQREGAGYVADIAKTGFDASLTAAIIAPNPITWGAVAVTGIVWGGAELVDHWDEVTAAAGQAADWVGDRLDNAAHVASEAVDAVADAAGDAVDAVADAAGDAVDAVANAAAGDAIDAVKSSPLNPGNWF